MPSLLPLLALLSLFLVNPVAAQLPSSAPDCATMCFRVKLSEADSLAPGVDTSNVAGLCSSANFRGAYEACLQDNCSPADATTGQALGEQVCGAAATSSDIAASASSTLASVASSASSAVSSAASRASSLAASAEASESIAGIVSATASLASSLDSVASSLDSRVSTARASVTSSVASVLSSVSNSLASASASSSSGAFSHAISLHQIGLAYCLVGSVAAVLVGALAVLA
ncbi:hypothetical protein JCM8097_000090 [Rhodosporidiobolus ruineniae]